MTPRIVSLLPSSSEIVFALGLGDSLVGRSHECDFPARVKQLPVCTEARLADGTSREIDDRVRELVSRALSIYHVDADTLASLRPDLVLTQSQCEVCAASLGDVERALAAWTGERPRVLSLSPQTLGDVWGDIVRVGEAAGAADVAHKLVSTLTDRVTEIGETTGALSAPSVACIEWLDPLMGAGNWAPELVRLAGGTPLFGQAGAHSPWLEWDALVDADPDWIVLMPCGFDLTRTLDELPALTREPRWKTLRAVSEGRVVAVDGNAFFNRPGPRLVESLEILAEILHPDAFSFGHRHVGWRGVAA